MAKNVLRLPTYSEEVPGADAMVKALRAGMPIDRLDSRFHVHSRTLSIVGNNGGLQYSPSKKRGKQVILFTDLLEISREEPYAQTYQKARLLPTEKTIVNVRSSNGKHWRLVFHTTEECNAWFNAIGFILQSRLPTTQTTGVDSRIRSMWDRADGNLDGKLSLKEVKQLLTRLSFGSVGDKKLRHVFEQCDTSGDGSLDLEEFRRLYMLLIDRPELRSIFEAHAIHNSDEGMTLSEFEAFLKKQGDPPGFGREQFKRFGIALDKYLSFTLFVVFLLDFVRNSAIHPCATTVVDDMNHPLCHYFINSSHNTYLTGNQLGSSSSVAMYREALMAGCRCVEVDCWDGPNNDPIVYHGYTYTSKIRFEDVIESINEHAFVVSEYPVILSLEVHTSPEQSRVMAEILQRVMGEKLLMAEDIGNVVFTPKGLRKRFLVKWEMLDKEFENSAEEAEEGEGDGVVAPSQRIHATSCPELSRCVSVGIWRTQNWGKDAGPHMVQSFTEVKVRELAKTGKENLQLQNTRMLSRVYPKGTRVDSSNYDPMTPWLLGCHMVALNFQTWDEPHRMNDGMFLQNGRGGYVLKPAFLVYPERGLSSKHYTLRVTVVCGAQLPRPGLKKKGDAVDPYVKLKIVGETTKSSVQTKTVWNNGLKPVWDETFELSGTCVELDILTIRVMDANLNSDTEVCDANIPVRLLRNGYRAVPMRLCASGIALQSATVLCYFKLTLEGGQEKLPDTNGLSSFGCC